MDHVKSCKYGRIVRDNPKLLDDGGEIHNLKEEVGNSIPDYEISSLQNSLDRKHAR